jgi:DNA-binding transcriptional ArsR family regulator
MPEQAGSAEEPSKAAPIFAALGDPVRLAMVARLSKDGPLRTIELIRGTGVTRQGLTKHLQVLEQAGLVSSDRFGRDRQWRMRPEQLANLRHCLDRIAAQWDLRLERLRAFVEDHD